MCEIYPDHPVHQLLSASLINASFSLQTEIEWFFTTAGFGGHFTCVYTLWMVSKKAPSALNPAGWQILDQFCRGLTQCCNPKHISVRPLSRVFYRRWVVGIECFNGLSLWQSGTPRFSELNKRMADEKMKLSGSVMRLNYSKNYGITISFFLFIIGRNRRTDADREFACRCVLVLVPKMWAFATATQTI